MRSDGTVIIDTELRTDDFERSIEDLEQELQDLEYIYDTLKDMKPYDGQIQELEIYKNQIEEVNKKLIKMRGIQSLPKNQAMSNEQATPDAQQIDTYISQTEKKLLKQSLIAVGVLGVLYASATAVDKYLERNEDTANRLKGIGQAFSNLASQIGNAIINFIGPYIDAFVSWLEKLVAYLNVFIKALTGGRLDMSRSMAKNEKATDKTTKAIGKQTGAMKELNKQLTKFDEATILQDNKSGAGGGLDGGVNIGGEGIDEGTNVIDTLLDPTKVEKLENLAERIREAALWFVDPIGQAKTLVATWNDLQDDLDNAAKKGDRYYEVQEKVKNISRDVSASVEQVTGALSANTRKVQGSHDAMQKNVNTIKDYGLIMGGLDYLLRGNNSLIIQNTSAIKENASETQDAIENNREMIKNKKLTKEQIKELIDMYIEERSQLRKIREQLPKNSAAYNELDLTIEMLSSDIRKYGDETQYSQKKVEDMVLAMKKGVEETTTVFDDVINRIGLFNKTSLVDKTLKLAIETDTNKAQSSLVNLANNVANSFQSAFNKLDLFASIRKQVSGMASDVAVSIRKVFGLAKGGIINLPGPGVPLSNGVVGGERAPEGVIPYTDNQVMDVLGEAIGRHVTINATIVNSMNGRVISRELQKVNNEETFGANR